MIIRFWVKQAGHLVLTLALTFEPQNQSIPWSFPIHSLNTLGSSVFSCAADKQADKQSETEGTEHPTHADRQFSKLRFCISQPSVNSASGNAPTRQHGPCWRVMETGHVRNRQLG